MKKNKNTHWFTLIETLVGILIFSIIILAGFSAFNSILIGKVKLIERTAIQKEAFYFSEKLFEMIKTWGTIDYEEYWNRYSYDTTYWSWHFLEPSGFGNYGSDWLYILHPGPPPEFWWYMYYCISQSWTSIWNNGCLTGNNVGIWWTQASYTPNESQLNLDYSWHRQRYNAYSLQFIDFNSDADNDFWDEDGSWPGHWNFLWDDDDLYLWVWPEAFPSWIDVGELYLINSTKTERTYFRWNVIDDPDAPNWSSCSWDQDMVWEWCLGTIEFLKLTWDDAGYDHGDNEWVFDNNGEIDTWYIHQDFESITGNVVADIITDYWQPLFPDTIHVKDVQFFPYPNKDLEYSWRDSDPAVNIAPYVRISMTLTPSWKSRKKIRWEVPEIQINTTIQLTDIFN